MKTKLTTIQRNIMAKIYHKCMNNETISIMKTDAWASDIIRSLKADGSPECIAMAVMLELVYETYHDAIKNKRVDRDDGTMSVDAFRVEQKSLTGKLKMLEAKIMVKMPTNYESVLKNLDLDNIKVYNKGAQSEQVLSLEILKVKITNFAEIIDLIPETEAIITEVKEVYEAKENKFKHIKNDATNVLELKSDVAEVILKIFGKLTDLFSKTPYKIIVFFDLEIVTDEIRSEEFKYVNQFALQGYQGTILHADIVNFDFEDSLSVECKGPLAIEVYLTSVVDNMISILAQRVEPGKTKTFAIKTIGASTQRKLMVAIAPDHTVSEPCKFIITVIKPK